MKIKPMHNYVLVKMEKDGGVERKSGLFAPTSKEKQVFGTVVETGPDVQNKNFSNGSLVLIPPYGAGKPLIYNNVRYMLFLDHEVLGVFA